MSEGEITRWILIEHLDKPSILCPKSSMAELNEKDTSMTHYLTTYVMGHSLKTYMNLSVYGLEWLGTPLLTTNSTNEVFLYLIYGTSLLGTSSKSFGRLFGDLHALSRGGQTRLLRLKIAV